MGMGTSGLRLLVFGAAPVGREPLRGHGGPGGAEDALLERRGFALPFVAADIPLPLNPVGVRDRSTVCCQAAQRRPQVGKLRALCAPAPPGNADLRSSTSPCPPRLRASRRGLPSSTVARIFVVRPLPPEGGSYEAGTIVVRLLPPEGGSYGAARVRYPTGLLLTIPPARAAGAMKMSAVSWDQREPAPGCASNDALAPIARIRATAAAC
jgi:hypothetical protein